MSGVPSKEQLAVARREAGVPDTFLWDWCAAECGTLVFYSPIYPKILAAKRVTFVPVCSNPCAATMSRRVMADD